MVGIIAALVGIGLTLLGLIFKISFFAAEQKLVQSQLLREMELVRHIPIMIFRLTRLEQTVGISTIEMPTALGAKKDA